MADPFEIPMGDEQLPDTDLETEVARLIEAHSVREILEVLQCGITEVIEGEALDPFESDRYHRLASALAVAQACATTLNI